MITLVVKDPDLRRQLRRAKDFVSFVDEAGKSLGTFVRPDSSAANDDIQAGRTKSFTNLDEMLKSLKKPF